MYLKTIYFLSNQSHGFLVKIIFFFSLVDKLTISNLYADYVQVQFRKRSDSTTLLIKSTIVRIIPTMAFNCYISN